MTRCLDSAQLLAIALVYLWVRSLLDAGAEVNYQDLWGWTAPKAASQQGLDEIAEMLRHAGHGEVVKLLEQAKKPFSTHTESIGCSPVAAKFAELIR